MGNIVITKPQIVEGLLRLGGEPGDVLLVHSALSSLGRVDGGADTVIQALLDVLSPRGTLMMPTFAGPPPFDVRNTPSNLGLITETFRRYPGVIRSFHPTHSVAVLGPRANELVHEHIKSPTAMGRDTPFGRLIEMNGKILLLGVDNDRNTTMHTLEIYAQACYLTDRDASYLDDRGRLQTLRVKSYPGPHRSFIGVDSLLRNAGAMTIGKVGQAVARLIDARRMHDAVLAAFKDDPALVLCDNPECADCVMQRAKIWLARLAKEDFVLSALSSSISEFPDQIAMELGRAGISDLVIDRLYGLPVWRVEEKLLQRAARTLAEENIAVSAVHFLPEAAGLDRGLAIARTFGCRTLIVPLVMDAKPFVTWGRENGVKILFENGPLLSRTCLDLLTLAGAENSLVFNPAAFVLLGEKPFLGIYSKCRLKRYVEMLCLTDATFGGAYTLPGRGNGEIRELLSILRCRSFPGRVIVATGPGGPKFRDLMDAFWRLLDAM